MSTSNSADGITSAEVEQLAIKLWLEWTNYQDGFNQRVEWHVRGGMDGTLALGVEWANMGQHQRNAWYAVAERARELARP